MNQYARATAVATPVTPRAPMSAPSTPSAQIAQEEGTPGKWKHPQFNEITRRQHATAFDERNVKILATNGVLLLATFIAPSVIEHVAPLRVLSLPLFKLLHQLPYHGDMWILLLFRLAFLYNISRALMPLVRRRFPDDLADIPLTPSQRQAMGLKPGVPVPQVPGSPWASPSYVTPPRYQKSTPRGSFSNPSGSPRPNLGRSTSNSPGTGSPLYQKAVNGGSAARRSLGGSTPSSSFFGESGSSAPPSTPTPSTGKASVGLNNKWLYEKRRDSPRSGLFSPIS